MPTIEIALPSAEGVSDTALEKELRKKLQVSASDELQFRIIKKSLDARSKNIKLVFLVEYVLNGELAPSNFEKRKWQNVNNAKPVAIIGAGPAGLFAAIQLIELNYKPVIIEHGKTVRDRRRDLAAINKQRIINPNSNYCFGEGGAGTYSDGKLYTRSTKRGDIKKVLDVFIQHGADERIGYEAHPHIGTNKLPRIIENMRETILANGGEVHFNQKATDFLLKNGTIKKIVTADGTQHDCQNIILATGHSARDIFELLDRKKILIEAKPFALGVRIEHPQTLIDSIQYKCSTRSPFLPPSSYSLVAQAGGRGVFSFCMCPGGVIAPAMTNLNETVVNGWSSSARNGPFANSGMVVAVNPENWKQFGGKGALAALEFQKQVEQTAYQSTGSIHAPAQRMEDFIQNKFSSTLQRTSYIPGVVSSPLDKVLPRFVTHSLREAFIDFGRKMKGYRTNEALLVGVESRTSSPVRIPRQKETLRHLQISNLFPCGEGAGYAGGIVSAAMDGIACANAVAQ